MLENKRLVKFRNADKTAGSIFSSVYFPNWKEHSGSSSIPINLGKMKEINYVY
jgi:hypothetical protein